MTAYHNRKDKGKSWATIAETENVSDKLVFCQFIQTFTFVSVTQLMLKTIVMKNVYDSTLVVSQNKC